LKNHFEKSEVIFRKRRHLQPEPPLEGSQKTYVQEPSTVKQTTIRFICIQRPPQATKRKKQKKKI